MISGGPPWRPATDAMLTIAPPSPAIMARPAACEKRKTPVRLTSTTFCQPSSGISSGIAHVAAQAERPDAELLELGGGLLATVGLARAEDDVRPGFGQALSHLAADALASSGHDRRLAAEIEQLHESASETTRTVVGSRVEIRSVVAPESFQAASRSRIRSGGPTSASSSISASGTAEAASRCLPSRKRSWICLASASNP